MSAVSTWSTTAASNNEAPPDGFPEGMNPSDVNNSCREVMAAIATWRTALDVTTIELGHATDTTLSRPAAGRMQIEGVEAAKGTPTLGYIPVGDGTTFSSKLPGAADVFMTGTISPTANPTYDFGRICRITLNARYDAANIRVRVQYAGSPATPNGSIVAADFEITTRQTDVLNNDPSCTIECAALNNKGNDLIEPTYLTAFYTISATESYVDIYMTTDSGNDRMYACQFSFIELFGTAEFTPYNAEAAIAALSWDVTSEATRGVIVYDEDIDLDNDFTGGAVHLTVTRLDSGYKCFLDFIENPTHASDSSPQSSAFIPSAYRPYTDIIVINSIGTPTVSIRADSGGYIQFYYSSGSTGTNIVTPLSWYVAD